MGVKARWPGGSDGCEGQMGQVEVMGVKARWPGGSGGCEGLADGPGGSGGCILLGRKQLGVESVV